MACSFLFAVSSGLAASAEDPFELRTIAGSGQMIDKVNDVRFQPPGRAEQPAAIPTALKQGDQLQTMQEASALVSFAGQPQVRLWELTRLQVVSITETNTIARVHQGRALVNSRVKNARQLIIQALETTTNPKGTDYLVDVDPVAGRTTIGMFDGSAVMSDGRTNVTILAGQQGIAINGRGIEVRTLLATNLIQWWLYYPGVLYLPDLPLSADDQQRLEASLDSYRSGNLPDALRLHPEFPDLSQPRSNGERIYTAGILLANGSVDRAEQLLLPLDPNTPPVRALRTLIGAVQHQNIPKTPNTLGIEPPVRRSQSTSAHDSPPTASELLASSYARQAQGYLDHALILAREATGVATNFGLAWARVAELEFSFGRIREAREAIDQALKTSPANAQAVATRGFLLAAEYRVHEALAAFERAIQIDPLLANGWLGRGLCKRRLGWFYHEDVTLSGPNNGPTLSWSEDLHIAALLEPARSLLHSYSGKAFSETGEPQLALQAYRYARRLDTNDPTPPLYTALTLWEQHRFNEAIAELEQSAELSDNRGVYRSRLRLDEDLAVRSATLAKIYREAGLPEVAFRAAVRAESQDYANYAGHLFLADSYDSLRDPTRFNLRNETPWYNELLLANMLAPVGAGTFSQNISQQEYGRLFEANRLGLNSATQYRSDGQWREQATQSGTIGRFGYALDLDYQHNEGVRPNNELDRQELHATLKYALTARDTMLGILEFQDYHSGDNFQRIDPGTASRSLTIDDQQQPIALAGYHHEWSPGHQTLILGGRLENSQQVNQDSNYIYALGYNTFTPPAGPVSDVNRYPFQLQYCSQLEIYTLEFNEILESVHHRLVTGARGQSGEFSTWNRLQSDSMPAPSGAPTNYLGNANADFHRIVGYAYWTWKLLPRLQLTGGLSYDTMVTPTNFRHPPVGDGESSDHLLAPKAAAIWTPIDAITLRGAFTRELAGASLDQSFRLEPAQLVGFSQASRTLISESLVGSVSAPEHQVAGLAMDVRLPSRTYLGLELQELQSSVNREIGVFQYGNVTSEPIPGSTEQNLYYEERSLGFTVHQLLGNEWSIGSLYQYIQSGLQRDLPEIGVQEPASAHRESEGSLHHLSLRLQFQHPSGLFSRVEADWYGQQLEESQGATTSLASSDRFWQINLYGGWRFRRHRGDVTLGVLNISGQNYHLSPLTPYTELPRERVFYAALRLNF